MSPQPDAAAKLAGEDRVTDVERPRVADEIGPVVGPEGRERARLDRRDVLSRAGFRATHPRIKVLAALERASGEHLSAGQIHDQVTADGDRIALPSVYRVLAQFVDSGLVARHVFEGENAVYELDRGAHHDHLVCVHCGHVTEFSDPVIEQRQNEIAARFGFKLGDHAMVLYGACSSTPCPNAKRPTRR